MTQPPDISLPMERFRAKNSPFRGWRGKDFCQEVIFLSFNGEFGLHCTDLDPDVDYLPEDAPIYSKLIRKVPAFIPVLLLMVLPAAMSFGVATMVPLAAPSAGANASQLPFWFAGVMWIAAFALPVKGFAFLHQTLKEWPRYGMYFVTFAAMIMIEFGTPHLGLQ